MLGIFQSRGKFSRKWAYCRGEATRIFEANSFIKIKESRNNFAGCKTPSMGFSFNMLFLGLYNKIIVPYFLSSYLPFTKRNFQKYNSGIKFLLALYIKLPYL